MQSFMVIRFRLLRDHCSHNFQTVLIKLRSSTAVLKSSSYYLTEWVRYFVKKTSFIVLEIVSTVDRSAILPKARAKDSWFRLLASAQSHSTWWCLLSRGSLHCPIQASIWVHDVIVLRSPFCCKSSLYNKLISISAGATQPGKTMVVLKCENWSSHRRKREREKENISRISQFFSPISFLHLGGESPVQSQLQPVTGSWLQQLNKKILQFSWLSPATFWLLCKHLRRAPAIVFFIVADIR